MKKTFALLRVTLVQLSARQKTGLLLSVFLRMLLSGLDLVGIALVGAIASVLSGPKVYENYLPEFLDDFFSNWPSSSVMVTLIICAAMMFTLKSIASYLVLRYVNNYMAKLEASISEALFGKILKSDLDTLGKWSKQEIVFGLSGSVSASYTQFYTAWMSVIVEAAMILSIAGYLFIVNPALLIGSVVVFSALFVGINLSSGRKTSRYARQNMELSIRANKTIFEILENFRQFRVSDKNDLFIESFADSKKRATSAGAKMMSLNNLQRYLIEATLVAALGLILALSQILEDFTFSAETTAVFAAGSFRIIGSLLPIQTSLNSLRQSLVDSSIATSMLRTFDSRSLKELSVVTANPEVHSLISLKSVFFQYADKEGYVLENCSLDLREPGFVAVTGKSGVGKSTLVDLIFGLRTPVSGTITLFGRPPKDFIKENPGQVAYVPQFPTLIEGSIFRNITLSDNHDVDPEALETAINKSALKELILSLPQGIETMVSGNSVTLSGGQAQRICLARALYQNPRVIILDESTNALDYETEGSVLGALKALSAEKLVIVTSHSPRTLDLANYRILLDDKSLKFEKLG